MKDVPVPPAIVAQADEHANWSEQQCLQFILQRYKDSLDALLECGSLIVNKERQGMRFRIDKQDEKLFGHLRRIGLGLLLPETFNYYAGMDRLRDLIGSFTPEEQQRFVDGATVPFVVIENGQTKVYQKDPKELIWPGQVKQVFATGRVRSEAEQVSWINEQKRKASLPLPSKIGPFEIDEEVLTISTRGRAVATFEDVERTYYTLRKLRDRKRPS